MKEFSPVLDSCNVEMIVEGLGLLKRKMDADVLGKIEEIVIERINSRDLDGLIHLFNTFDG